MKRILAMLLAVMLLLLSLAACSKEEKKESGKETAKVNLKTFEMEAFPDGVEEPAKVTVGYPENFEIEKTDWCVILTDEEKDVMIECYLTNDYNCYNINQEYAMENYPFYEEGKYGKFNGYACMVDEASASVDVNVYVDCVAEMDDVYMTFYISSASYSVDADPQDFYAMEEVKQVLNSVEYTTPAK